MIEEGRDSKKSAVSDKLIDLVGRKKIVHFYHYTVIAHARIGRELIQSFSLKVKCS